MMLCARGPDFRFPRRGRPVHLSSAAHLGRPAVLDRVALFARIAAQADSRAARTVHSAGRFVRPVGGSSPCRLPSIVLPRTRDWRILDLKNCCNLVAIESREVGPIAAVLRLRVANYLNRRPRRKRDILQTLQLLLCF